MRKGGGRGEGTGLGGGAGKLPKLKVYVHLCVVLFSFQYISQSKRTTTKTNKTHMVLAVCSPPGPSPSTAIQGAKGGGWVPLGAPGSIYEDGSDRFFRHPSIPAQQTVRQQLNMGPPSVARCQASLAGSDSLVEQLPCPRPLPAAAASPLSWAASASLLSEGSGPTAACIIDVHA